MTIVSKEQIAIIQATIPAVESHAREITECFYPILFKRYPQVKEFFNQTHQETGAQRQALANAIIAYAKNIERLEILGDAVSLIVQKHCSLNIQPDQYPMIGECLLAGIAEVLGEAVTVEVADAWGAAYNQLAEILISAEENLYQENAKRLGGWRGEKSFKLMKREKESEVISSLYLEPESGDKCIDFTPGQYVAIVMTIDGQTVRRNYSLSNEPGLNYLRISVKREKDGLVSNFLHNKLQVGELVSVTAPCGDFVLKSNKRPLALVSGGVGITPTISMLNVAAKDGRDVYFVHAARNQLEHSFKKHVDHLVKNHDNIKKFYCYSEPHDDDTPDKKGFIGHDMLKDFLPDDLDVDFYFLGPKPFMQSVMSHTHKLGIKPNQIHYEFFGPLQELGV